MKVSGCNRLAEWQGLQVKTTWLSGRLMFDSWVGNFIFFAVRNVVYCTMVFSAIHWIFKRPLYTIFVLH